MDECRPTANRSDATATRLSLLNAAGRIVRRDGVTRLTLEAVAAEAGVSKGGVLYHFRTKEALVAAFVEGVGEAFEADLAREEAADDGPEAGRALRAYVRAATMPDPVPDLTAGLVAAVAWDSGINAEVQRRFTRWRARATAGLADPVLGLVVCLAADGLWLSDWFGLVDQSADERALLATRLLALADVAAAPGDGPLGLLDVSAS